MATQTLTATTTAPHTSVVAAEYDRRVRLFNRICVGVLIAFALLWLIPVLWAIDTALKPNAETTRTTWLIQHPTFDAFVRTLQDTDMLNWYLATFITAALTALITVIAASMAAYPLSRMRFRYKNAAFWFILIGIMIPGQVLIVPQFREFDSVHLLNTYWAVILPKCRPRSPSSSSSSSSTGCPANSTRRPRSTGRTSFGSTGRSSCPCPGPPLQRWRSSPSSPPGTTCCGRCWC